MLYTLTLPTTAPAPVGRVSLAKPGDAIRAAHGVARVVSDSLARVHCLCSWTTLATYAVAMARHAAHVAEEVAKAERPATAPAAPARVAAPEVLSVGEYEERHALSIDHLAPGWYSYTAPTGRAARMRITRAARGAYAGWTFARAELPDGTLVKVATQHPKSATGTVKWAEGRRRQGKAPLGFEGLRTIALREVGGDEPTAADLAAWMGEELGG